MPHAFPIFDPAPPEHRPTLIPAWAVPLLSLPLRKLWDRPSRLVAPLIHPGDRVLEVGPGSGFFTFPMAQEAGPAGRVVCVELQEPVRRRLERAAARLGLEDTVSVRPCAARDLQIPDLADSMDLAVAIDVLHETPDPAAIIAQMAAALRPGGRLLVREPRGHCPEPVFRAETAWAVQAGLVRLRGPWEPGSRALVALFGRE